MQGLTTLNTKLKNTYKGLLVGVKSGGSILKFPMQIEQTTMLDFRDQTIALPIFKPKQVNGDLKIVSKSTEINSLDLFVKQLKKYPLLSAEQQRYYLKLAQQGDLKARNQMICCNLRLVIKFAKQYQNHHLDLLELIQEGVFGLIAAIRKFDFNKGCRFSTYAAHWIEESLSRALMNKKRTIRLPVHISQAVNKINKALKKDETLSPSEIAKKINMPVEKVRTLLEIDRDVVSYDQESNEQGGAWIHIIPDPTADFQARLDNEQLRQQLFEGMQVLQEKHQAIMIERFGLNGEEPKTLEEIAVDYHLSRERIRQIIAESLLKMKNELKDDKPNRILKMEKKKINLY